VRHGLNRVRQFVLLQHSRAVLRREVRFPKLYVLLERALLRQRQDVLRQHGVLYQ
jgi:hypothetical protein